MMGLMRNRAVPACGMDNPDPLVALITLAMTLLVGIALGAFVVLRVVAQQ